MPVTLPDDSEAAAAADFAAFLGQPIGAAL
jgi:hypothetical protein